MPFERLRALVRRGRPEPERLVELAECLADLAGDPGALVVGCRQLVHHHPEWGALWWLCSRALVEGPDGAREAAACLVDDATTDRLAAALAFPPTGSIAWLGATLHLEGVRDLRPDVDLDPAASDPVHACCEAWAIGREAFVPAGTTGALDALRATVPVWLVAPVGTVLPSPLLDALSARTSDLERVSFAAFDRVAGPRGLGPLDTLDRRATVPVAAELLRGG